MESRQSVRRPASPPARVWLPEPPAVYSGLPDGLVIDVYDGSAEPPESLAGVTFYVPPYMAGPHTVELVASMPALEVVQTLTAGVENVRPHLGEGVTLCNARGVHDASTAELGVALILASLRGIPEFVHAQTEHRWADGRRQALADKRVVVLGAGSIGQALARRLAPFECEVTLVGRTARGGVAGAAQLADLLPAADVVVLLVPMTDETRGMVDAKFLAQLKDGALLVNIARGPIVQSDALLAELSSGRLRAAVDVTDPEPLPATDPLWDAPGLLLSPHVGGNTSAFVPRGRALVSAQLRRYVAGEPLANVVTGSY
ncbi:2-hydroxyacid dehydrogenase [Actinopolymorpha sp. B17G11]|uniref:2-hydroxyacid dehydrogenase n=1 Tax=unclassified Actinopolymorpha TaxID=2627063 RepID=UPI0032D95441